MATCGTPSTTQPQSTSPVREEGNDPKLTQRCHRITSEHLLHQSINIRKARLISKRREPIVPNDPIDLLLRLFFFFFFFRFSLLCRGMYYPYYTFRLREVGGMGSGGSGVVLFNLRHLRSCPDFFLISSSDVSLTSSSSPSAIPLRSFSFHFASILLGGGVSVHRFGEGGGSSVIVGRTA